MTPIYTITQLVGRYNGDVSQLTFEPGELLFQPDVPCCKCLGTFMSETVTGITRIEYIILAVDLKDGKCWHQPFYHDFKQPVDFMRGEMFVPFHKGKLMRPYPLGELIAGCKLRATGFQFVA